jgi:formylglycine-generating enzyme required for sulfatase activity
MMFPEESTRREIKKISKMIESDKPYKSTSNGCASDALVSRRGFLKRLTVGGGLNSHPRHCRSAFRLPGHRPDYRSFISSFRVVREASGRKK